MSHITSELLELTGLFCDGDMTPEQAVRLEALVAESADSRRYVVDSFRVHCELAWKLIREVECPPEPRLSGQGDALPGSRLVTRRPRRWLAAAVSLALLLTVAVALTLVFGVRRDGLQLPPMHVAHIGQLQDVRWIEGTAAAPAVPLPPGRKLAIQRGLLQICFDSGASIIVQGPAEIELQSANSAVLHKGSLAAKVPVEGRGFAISTPNATLVDLGTRFGVAYDPDETGTAETEVEVFAGNVVLRPSGPEFEGPPERGLVSHDAVRVRGIAGTERLRVEPMAAGSRNFVQSFQECSEAVAPASACPTVPQAKSELLGPWHCPRGKLVPLDLSRQANWKYTDSTPDRIGNNLAELPRGKQLFAGVEFQIPDRWIQLHGMGLPNLPRSVTGITVGRKVARLFILHGTQFAHRNQGVNDGDLVGEYRVRYADGDRATIPVVIGQDVRDWWATGQEPISRSQVVWVGENRSTRTSNNMYLRLYLATWKNPRPEKTVESIDYAAVHATAGPFCVAITAEDLPVEANSDNLPGPQLGGKTL